MPPAAAPCRSISATGGAPAADDASLIEPVPVVHDDPIKKQVQMVDTVCKAQERRSSDKLASRSGTPF